MKKPQPEQLNPRQIEIIDQICKGKSDKQIAVEIGLSEQTVDYHVGKIFKILGASNRPNAVFKWILTQLRAM